MAKKTKSKDHRWTVTLIAATPAKYLGAVYAPSEAEAIARAAKEFRIPEALRNRIVAREED